MTIVVFPRTGIEVYHSTGVTTPMLSLKSLRSLACWPEIVGELTCRFNLDCGALEQDLDQALAIEGSGELTELSYRIDSPYKITAAEFFEILAVARQKEETARAKRILTAVRRREFSARRAATQLAMINAGTPYVCSEGGCNATSNLTIDHIVALSRGGTDDLSNLQFLCRTHNSAKGDQQIMPAEQG